jgi:hypothetical protein
VLKALLVATVAAHPKLLGLGATFHAAVVVYSAADGASDPATLKVALIGGLALVLSASLPALISTLRKSGGPDPTVKALIESNNQRRREYTELHKDYTKANKRIDELEGMLWENGINPHTGVRIQHPGTTL